MAPPDWEMELTLEASEQSRATALDILGEGNGHPSLLVSERSVMSRHSRKILQLLGRIVDTSLLDQGTPAGRSALNTARELAKNFNCVAIKNSNGATV
jgi:hypothetical protein